MKKIFTKMMLWAVAATAIVSCENNFEEQTPGVELTQTVTLTADKTGVRTELIEGVPYWSADDQIGVYVQSGDTYENYAFKNDNEEASLTTTFTGTTAVANTLYVYYPYVAGSEVINGEGVVKANLLSAQQPTAASFDGAADIMIAKPVILDEEGKQLSNLEFARLGAIAKVVLKDNTGLLAEQHISTITMTTANDIAGKVYIDAINQELGKLYDEASRSKSVTANYTTATQFVVNGENAVYFVIYPTTLASGSALSFAAATEDYTIAKEVTLPEDYVFESGKVATLTVNLAAEHITKNETIEWVNNAYNLIPSTAGLDVGDKVVIAAAGYDVALSTTQNSNNRGETAITKNANNTIDFDSSVEVLTVEAGNIDGTFAFKTSDNKYLYAASSSNNYLRSEETLSDNSSFIVTITDGVASVTAQGTNTKNIMRYNYNNKMFSCYGSGQNDISIYKLVGEYEIKAPAITLSVANATVEYDATSGEAVVTATNGDGWAITATTEATWVSALAYADGKITFTTTTNEDEEKDREATVTVTATKADYEDVIATFTITQGKKMAAGEVVSGEGTISFASTAQRTAYSTSSQTWSNEGITFVNDKSSSTSNVADYSNPVRLYANSKITVTAPGNITKIVFDANSSSYATALNNSIGTPSGATVSVSGDKVTVTITNGSTEFVVASLSSQVRLDSITVTYGGSSDGGETPATPVLTVNPATLSFDAAAASKTVECTIENEVSGVSVTATEDVDWIETSVSDKTVTITVTENTGDARNATVTIAYEGAKSKTVTVKQDAKPNENGGVNIELVFNTADYTKKVSSYTTTWEHTYGGYKYSIVNFNNNNAGWSYIKCGSKNGTSVASINTTFAIPWSVANVTVTVDAVTTSKINSTYLVVATDANFSNVVETVNASIAKGNVVYTITNPGANYYYKVVYDCAQGSSNGLVQISKVVYTAN